MCPTSARWLVLQNTRQFGVVMQQGRVAASSPHFVLHAVRWLHPMHTAVQQSDEARPRSATVFPAISAAPAYYGTIVPKRWARRAVTRNLIKRQIRHVVGAYAPSPSNGLALVLRLRAAFDPQQFISASSSLLRQAVRAELNQLLQQASQQNWHTLSCLPAPPSQTNAQSASPAQQHHSFQPAP